jgi:hypothetical protein
MDEEPWQWSRPKAWRDVLRFAEYLVKERNRQRKAMLALCAVCRITWEHVALECNRKALEASESYADGLISQQELEHCWRNTRFEPVVYCEWICAAAGPANRDDVLANLSPVSEQDNAALATFHSTFTNDVRKGWWSDQLPLALDVLDFAFRDAHLSPEWRTSTALALARQMYESRDFSAMPILADALQDAGCDNDDVLNHCRDANATHVRGCWVVDLVLGKE